MSSDRVQTIHSDLFAELRKCAEASPRRRTNHNFHATLEDPIHRFLNVMLKGSFFTPHRHLLPPKPESFLVLEGLVAILVFTEAESDVDADADGGVAGAAIVESLEELEQRIESIYLLGERSEAERLGFSAAEVVYGLDIAPGVWHTLLILSEVAVCFEVKLGPFRPIDDKEFAPWAPREGAPEVAAFAQHLEGAVTRRLAESTSTTVGS